MAVDSAWVVTFPVNYLTTDTYIYGQGITVISCIIFCLDSVDSLGIREKHF